MTKQEQIEEMAKDILFFEQEDVKKLVKETVKYFRENPKYSSKTDFNKAHEKPLNELLAESLYNAGYRKGKTISYQAMIDHSYLDRINQLENRIMEVRKETAKDILERGKYCMPSGLRDWIKEHYGVEVEE